MGEGLNIELLQSDIKAISEELKTYDGSEGKTQEDADKRYAELLSQAINRFTKGGKVVINNSTVALHPQPGNGEGSIE